MLRVPIQDLNEARASGLRCHHLPTPKVSSRTVMGHFSEAMNSRTLMTAILSRRSGLCAPFAQADCQELARTNPGKAVTNTDSYQYFAENDPTLN
jgi:hypothetical protein